MRSSYYNNNQYRGTQRGRRYNHDRRGYDVYEAYLSDRQARVNTFQRGQYQRNFQGNGNFQKYGRQRRGNTWKNQQRHMSYLDTWQNPLKEFWINISKLLTTTERNAIEKACRSTRCFQYSLKIKNAFTLLQNRFANLLEDDILYITQQRYETEKLLGDETTTRRQRGRKRRNRKGRIREKKQSQRKQKDQEVQIVEKNKQTESSQKPEEKEVVTPGQTVENNETQQNSNESQNQQVPQAQSEPSVQQEQKEQKENTENGTMDCDVEFPQINSEQYFGHVSYEGNSFAENTFQRVSNLVKQHSRLSNAKTSIFGNSQNFQFNNYGMENGPPRPGLVTMFAQHHQPPRTGPPIINRQGTMRMLNQNQMRQNNMHQQTGNNMTNITERKGMNWWY